MPLIASEAASVPTVEGLKVTETVQLAPEAMVVPQLLEDRKSDAFAPLITMLVKVKYDVPLFKSVIVKALLVVPVVWLANARLVGVSVTWGRAALLFESVVQVLTAVQP